VNTILHLAAMLAVGWAALYVYDPVGQAPLAGALLILFFGYIVLTIAAIDDDWFLLSGKKMMGFRGEQREAISASSKIALVVTLFCFWVAAADFIW
jgi:hypothetical protein